MKQIARKTIAELFVTAHWKAYRVSKWIGCFIGLLTLIVAVLLLSGQIVADLSTDSGATLNPYLVLAIISAVLLTIVYILIFLVLSVVSGMKLFFTQGSISGK